jgi:pimeloyl-CoA synthetase
MIPSSDAPALEHALHKRFVRRQLNKVNPRKEFFRMKLSEIREEIERLRIQVSWTMAAECREFRESQSIDRALATNSMDEAAWEAGQLARERSVERELAEASS